MFYLRVFSIYFFLVFSVYKNPKSNQHLLFLAIFPDSKMLQFWSVNCICQVYKLYFYFGYVWNFGQYLYLSVLSKQWNTRFITIVLKTIFVYFLETKNACFATKNCSKSFYLILLILFYFQLFLEKRL